MLVTYGALQIVRGTNVNLMETVSSAWLLYWNQKGKTIQKGIAKTMIRKIAVQQIQQVQVQKLIPLPKLSFRNIFTCHCASTENQNYWWSPSTKKLQLSRDQSFNLVAHCLDDPEIPVFLNSYCVSK